MEYGSIVALVVAGLGLLAVIGTVIKEFRDTAHLSSDHENLSVAHGRLSKEHEELSIEQKELSRYIVGRLAEKHNSLKEQQTEIKQTVNFLKDTVLIEQGKNQGLSHQMLDIQRTSEHIQALVQYAAKANELESKNKELKMQNAELVHKNQELQKRLRYYEHQHDQEMEP